MDRRGSPGARRRAARLLARARIDIRLRLIRVGSKKVVPQPVYPREIFEEEDYENDDSNSTADSDTTLTDPDLDVYMDDGSDVQSGRHNTPMETTSDRLREEEQKDVEHLKYIQNTADIMDVPKDVQDDEDMDTFFYPDPITSEMVPPPTPRLPHVDLPIRSTEDGTINDEINETSDEVMGECEEGDLSSTSHLIHADGEPSNSSMERNGLTNGRKTDVSMHGNQDSHGHPHITHAAASLSMDTAGSKMNTLQQEPEERDLSDLRRQVWDDEQPWQPTIQDEAQAEESFGNRTSPTGTDQRPGAIARVGYVDTSEMDALQEGSEEMDLSDIPGRICEQSWWPDVRRVTQTERFSKHLAPPPGLSQIPGLGRIAVHRNNFMRSAMTDSRDESLPELAEQAPAAEPSTRDPSTNAAEQEEVPDRALQLSMENQDKMEAEVMAKAEADRRLLCRAHGAPASVHYTHYDPKLPVIARLEALGVIPVDRERKRSEGDNERIRKIRNTRFSLPPWKKHAVWERSLLCTEVKAEPFLDREGQFKEGQYREYELYHSGRGPTGGDPFVHFWRRCNCAENPKCGCKCT